ncbi:SagB/ThcOx family dehydrogenase [Alkalilimnicola ehrlichii MLHE-1]|uniref:Nitroreductase n=1 Tax=Alkalilimnicola ehrlichii (strain ATCC BAA-1101 / DSM 17681 / MLHE-1) TaxID=187272 RepID=Q0A5E8_ALKEH|nr:SagB/ThcOx family dehydrogenase [Alkalilimnicola ehrlichii]ABI57939.1 nitroreductase [Alkalilimnicola ehrlichii MLHE-1]
MWKVSAGLLLMIISFGALSDPQGEADRVVTLPEPKRAGPMALEQALETRRSVRRYAEEVPDLNAIAQLAWAAQGVSDLGRGLRTAPSAGATYPMEVDLLVRRARGLSPGVWRYRPDEHVLVRRLDAAPGEAVVQASLGQAAVARAPLVVALSAVEARTAHRYGERAARYVHMEAGHVAQNIYLQATALGLGTVAIGAFDDEALARALELGPGERPLYLLPIGYRR